MANIPTRTKWCLSTTEVLVGYKITRFKKPKHTHIFHNRPHFSHFFPLGNLLFLNFNMTGLKSNSGTEQYFILSFPLRIILYQFFHYLPTFRKHGLDSSFISSHGFSVVADPDLCKSYRLLVKSQIKPNLNHRNNLHHQHKHNHCHYYLRDYNFP